MLAVTLIITGLFIGHTALEQITAGSSQQLTVPGLLAMLAAVVSIIAKEAMYWYTRFYAKRLDSGALMADAWHHRSDCLLYTSTVTADAMSCQRAIAAQIRQGGADYVLALKGNQPALLEDVKFYFENERVASHKTNDKDHGRIESREYFLETDISCLLYTSPHGGVEGH